MDRNRKAQKFASNSLEIRSETGGNKSGMLGKFGKIRKAPANSLPLAPREIQTKTPRLSEKSFFPDGILNTPESSDFQEETAGESLEAGADRKKLGQKARISGKARKRPGGNGQEKSEQLEQNGITLHNQEAK